ncbi:unnamed protein product [Lampetra planeri]
MLRGAVAQRIAHSATNSDSSSQPTNTSDWSRASTIELDSATDRPAQLAGIPLSVAESALVNHSREPASPERRAMRTFIFDEPRGSREARLEPSGGGGGATLAARRVRHGATSTTAHTAGGWELPRKPWDIVTAAAPEMSPVSLEPRHAPAREEDTP